MSDDNSLLVTGASGFIGRHVMAAAGARAIPVSLRYESCVAERIDDALRGCQIKAIIHLGGRAHRSDASDPEALAVYRNDTCDLSVALAEAALERGIRRFVFVSSIGVHGQSCGVQAFQNSDKLKPETTYALAKLEAERALANLSQRGLELVIVRPPLVYGAGAPGNIERLLSLVARGLPLPLGAIRNKRSLVNVEDLADLLIAAADDRRAPDQVLLPADQTPISTPNLVRAMADALEKPAHLLPVPVSLLRLAGRLTHRTRTVGQLVDSLEIDPRPTMELLDWSPQRGLRYGLSAMVSERRKTGSA